MALSEKELEKKTLSEVSAMVRGYEQKSKDLAKMVGDGRAKPADLISMNSDLALLKKTLEKKLKEQSRLVPRGQPKSNTPLKSFEDYERSKGVK